MRLPCKEGKKVFCSCLGPLTWPNQCKQSTKANSGPHSQLSQKIYVNNYLFVGTCRALGGNDPLCSQGTPGFSPPKIYNAPCIVSGDYTNYPMSSSPPSTSSSSSGSSSSSPSAGSSPTGESPSSGAASPNSGSGGGSAASSNPGSGSGRPSSGTTAATSGSESPSSCVLGADDSPRSEQ